MSSVTLSQSVPKGNTNKRDSKNVRNRARSWCFTLNNYKEEDVVTLSHNKWENLRIKKFCFQEEIGEKNKIPHLQGVVQFEESVSFTTLKAFHDKIHWEKCRDLKGSIKYCSKENTRSGKLYHHGVLQKNLWKGKVVREGIFEWDIKYIYDDMRRQLQEDCQARLRLVIQPPLTPPLQEGESASPPNPQ